MPEGIHAAPQIDRRSELVLERLTDIDPLALVDSERLTIDALRSRLRWSERLNMAYLPERQVEPNGERKFRILAAHSTTSDAVVLEPRLSFDDIPDKHRTNSKNVYGTGLYVANRPEAAYTADGAREGRDIGTYISDPLAESEIVDRRRYRLSQEVMHLVGMVGPEMIMPKVLGNENAARRHAEKANKEWVELNAKLVLLNEAPRRRAEKFDHEDTWLYGEVPPQYGLLRVSMHRIGTFDTIPEQPRKRSALAMYSSHFWRMAIRNARDANALGAPHDFTSKGSARPQAS